jgi:signal transduction histidine kinase
MPTDSDEGNTPMTTTCEIAETHIGADASGPADRMWEAVNARAIARARSVGPVCRAHDFDRGSRILVDAKSDGAALVSEQRENPSLYREALLAIEARDRIIAIAGHELRGPLQTLMLQLDALADVDCGVGDGALAQLEAIRRRACALSRLVNILLDVGRIGSGQLELDRRPTDLAEIVVDAVESCAELTRSGSALTINAPRTIGFWDRTRLEQIVSNLISNAAKYGAGRPIHVIVDGDDERATLTVRDRGVGLTAEAIPAVFELYARVSNVQAVTGLGLGLYITVQLVRAHGGTIRVESVPGNGSTFIVELPRA